MKVVKKGLFLRKIQCGSRDLLCDAPKIMGILNVTPDSFYDGGQHAALNNALVRAKEMEDAGAHIIDVGGESTRPGADPVTAEIELERVAPVVDRLLRETDLVVSVDTSKLEVMKEAVNLGCHMINDVCALRAEGALELLAQTQVGIILMHMLGEPRSMQNQPSYSQVGLEVSGFLAQRIQACRSAGINVARIVIDPGFGFGKTTAHNLTMMKDFHLFTGLDLPVLVGLSRKSLIGTILDQAVDQRMLGSVVAGAVAIMRGASILRVHDVSETVQACKVISAFSLGYLGPRD